VRREDPGGIVMKKSIKYTFTMIFVGIVAALLLMMYVIQHFFLQDYYLNRKIGMLDVGYKTIDQVVVIAEENGETVFDLINREYGKNMEDSPTIAIFRTLNERSNIDVALLDSEGTDMASTSREGDWLAMKLRLYLLYKDYLVQDSDNIVPDPIENNSGDGQKKQDYPGMRNNGIPAGIEVLRQGDNYTVQKYYDRRSGSSYLEYWGTFSDGKTHFLMSMPLASIQEGVSVSNHFLLLTGLAVLVIGSIAVYFASRQITVPIDRLAALSERMSQLDFSARYEGNSENEIGRLGVSMNRMSERLEDTIGQLKDANLKLQDANLQLQEDIDQKVKVDEMRKEFIADVSHELKTPIALIEGYAEGLMEGLAEAPESRDYYCSVIVDESAKMNKMVRQLTSLISYEFGENKLECTEFNLAEMIRSVIASNRIQIEEAGVNLEMDLPENASVFADEFKIEEVFSNYLSNALHHASGEKNIRIRMEKVQADAAKEENRTAAAAEKEKPAAWRVLVYNDGNRIPEDSLPHLWEKFYKVDKARTRAYGGSGIGLSIVKAIMEAHKGQYGVENLENGVEFSFTLSCTPD